MQNLKLKCSYMPYMVKKLKWLNHLFAFALPPSIS